MPESDGNTQEKQNMTVGDSRQNLSNFNDNYKREKPYGDEAKEVEVMS